MFENATSKRYFDCQCRRDLCFVNHLVVNITKYWPSEMLLYKHSNNYCYPKVIIFLQTKVAFSIYIITCKTRYDCLSRLTWGRYIYTSICYNNCTSGVARTFGAHGQRTLRGPSPYFITLFFWPLPHIHLNLDFVHVSLLWFWIRYFLFSDDAMGKMGAPWWCNDELGPLDNVLGD